MQLNLYISVYRNVSYQSLLDFFSDELVSEAYRALGHQFGTFCDKSAQMPERIGQIEDAFKRDAS